MRNKILVASMVLCLSGCVTPTMQSSPKQEAGKGAVVLYSSTLQPTSYLNYSINNKGTGTIDGGKVQVVYLKPGQYNIAVNVPYVAEPLHQTVTLNAGKNYFLNVYSISEKKRNGMSTTYHFEAVNEADALHYLQGPKKFTGWTDLVVNTLNGKQFQ